MKKKLFAEAFGTFVLVFFACGVAALTNGSLVATSLAFGLVIVAMAYSVGRISGCHINPAVSLGCLIAKRMSLVEFLVYVATKLPPVKAATPHATKTKTKVPKHSAMAFFNKPFIKMYLLLTK